MSKQSDYSAVDMILAPQQVEFLDEEGFVVISKKKLESLEAVDKEMMFLERYGVDNWEGYGLAMSALYGNEEDEDEIDEDDPCRDM